MSWYLVTPGHKHVQLVTSGNMWSHLATARLTDWLIDCLCPLSLCLLHMMSHDLFISLKTHFFLPHLFFSITWCISFHAKWCKFLQFVSHHIRIWYIILQLCNKALYVWFRMLSWYEGIPSGTFIPSYHEKWRRQIEMLRNAASPQSSVQC